MPKKGPLQTSLESNSEVAENRPSPMDAHQALRVAGLLEATPNRRCTVVRNTWGGWSVHLWRITPTNDQLLLTINHAITEGFVPAQPTNRAYGDTIGHAPRPGGRT